MSPARLHVVAAIDLAGPVFAERDLRVSASRRGTLPVRDRWPQVVAALADQLVPLGAVSAARPRSVPANHVTGFANPAHQGLTAAPRP